MKKYIIGHTKPDTDAVVAAMGLEYLYNQVECFGNQGAQAVIADPLNPETSFLFDKFGVETPQLLTADQIKADDQVILVDHNEAAQRFSGVEDNQIIEIIDHHKVNLNLSNPIYLTFKPWGSSCTIVYHLLKTNDVKPDKTLAALMLAAILSDTVGFKSATCTERDKEYGQELAHLAEITDLDEFALEIFKAKSDVSQLSDKQIVTNDYKVFEFGNKKVLIDQLETVEQAHILETKKEGLLQAMAEIKEEQQVDLIFVAISDILQVNTKLLLLGSEETAVAEAAFASTAQDQIIDIGPKLSRKKEIAPAIEQAIIAQK